MKQIGVYEAKTNLTEILKRVDNGESFEITRHGAPVAMLIPHTDARKMSVHEAIAGIRAMRGAISFEGLNPDDLKQMIEEGRR